MKRNVTFSQFHDEFQAIRPDNFSYDGLQALYGWLCDFEEGTGEEIELDVIALCCEFSEYDSALDIATDYNINVDESAAVEDQIAETLEYLQENTIVIDFPGGVIIQDY